MVVILTTYIHWDDPPSIWAKFVPMIPKPDFWVAFWEKIPYFSPPFGGIVTNRRWQVAF